MNNKKSKSPRRAVVMGASSGIGFEVAQQLIARGWQVGVAARRADRLAPLVALAPERVVSACIDVTSPDAPAALTALAERLGGMDFYFHVAGVGHQDPELRPEVELETLSTNADGFARMVIAAFGYLAAHGGGRIAVISSIAGTKGLGVAPAYSATKAFQNVYIEALEQLAHLRGLPIGFTDVRPGFVATALLGDGRHYPMLMNPKKVARTVVSAALRGRSVVTVDGRYRVLVALWRMVPRWLWRRLPVHN